MLCATRILSPNYTRSPTRGLVQLRRSPSVLVRPYSSTGVSVKNSSESVESHAQFLTRYQAFVAPTNLQSAFELKEMMERCNYFKDHDKTIHLWNLWNAAKKRPEFSHVRAVSHAFFAQRKFDKMFEMLDIARKFNMEVTLRMYNNLITACVYKGDLEGALALFREIQDRRIAPNAQTYNTLIRTFAKHEQFSKAEELFSEMTEKNLVPIMPTLNAMIDIYSKADRTNEVEKVFNKIGELGYSPDIITYNTLLAMHARLGDHVNAEKTMEELRNCGIVPDDRTLSALVHLYAKQKDHIRAEQTFRDLLEKDFYIHVSTFNIMLDMYSVLGLLKPAELLFQMLIRGKGVKPDLITFNTMLDFYGTKLRKFEKAMWLFKQIAKFDLTPDVYSYNILFSMYGPLGYTKIVGNLLEEMRETGVTCNQVSYNILIDMYAKVKDTTKAKAVLEEMKSQGFSADKITTTILIGMHGECGNCDRASETFHEFLASGTEVDLTVFTEMIDIYEEYKRPTEAQEVYNIIEQKYPWIHKQIQQWRQERQQQQHRQDTDIKVTDEIYTKMLSTCEKIGIREDAEQIINQMTEKKFGDSEIIHVVSMIMCKNVGKDEHTHALLPKLIRKIGQTRNLEFFNTVMEIFSNFGMAREIEELFGSLPRFGLTPDEKTDEIFYQMKKYQTVDKYC